MEKIAQHYIEKALQIMCFKVKVEGHPLACLLSSSFIRVKVFLYTV